MAGTVKVAVALFGLAALVPTEIVLEQIACPAAGRSIRSRFDGMRNYDLKREGARTAARLRNYAAKLRLQEIETLTANSAAAFDRGAVLDENALALKIDAVQLRDEILQRLPRTRRPDIPYVTLDFATSAHMLEQGADALERLANLLPEMQYRDGQQQLPPARRADYPLWGV